MKYDLTFLGHYTKDTIVSPAGTRVIDGGACIYGAHVAVRMDLNTAVVTRLAREDFRVLEELKALGVDVFTRDTPVSTCLRLEYPSANLDERMIYVSSSAGAFTPEEVKGLNSRTIVIGGSIRGEIPPEVMETLAGSGSRIALDVQGFVRVARQGKLLYEQWPEIESVLQHVNILKTDAVEAEMLTGVKDLRKAAWILSDYGPEEIVLTHRNGLLVYAGNRYFEYSFFPKKIVGRSGRGDTCIASYAARRINFTPPEAAVWAATITSLKLEAEGPFNRDIHQVEALIQEKYLRT